MGLFGGIKKALFGGSKKKSTSKVNENVTTNSVQGPWAPAVPALTNYIGDTTALYKNTPQFSPLEQQGYSALTQAAGQASAALDPAIAANNKTLSGYYLDPGTNPYLQDIANRMGGQAQASANATFGGRGRTASGLNNYYLGQGVAGAVGDVYGENYNNERNRMLQASGQAPQLAAGSLVAPQALINAGQAVSARPYDLNAQYGGILGQIAGLGQTGTANVTGETVQKNYKQSKGLFGNIANALGDKIVGLFA